MGGNAFIQPEPNGERLYVPRMPREMYDKVKAQCYNILQTLFDTVVTPAEAPEKPDYGDVDFLVANDENHDVSRLQLLPTALRATRACFTPETVSLAIPWIEFIDNNQPETTLEIAMSVMLSPNPHVQVDVHLCPNHLVEWMEFKRAWGDFWQILGVMIRPFGLTANDQGLHVRVEEIEAFNKKSSMLFLTSNLHETLEFLGLDIKRYLGGFETEQELFGYIKQSRLSIGFQMDRRPENSNDRQRLRKRSMYVRFIQKMLEQKETEYNSSESYESNAGTQVVEVVVRNAPNCPSLKNHNESISLTREIILQECLNRFQKQEAFQVILESFRTEAREKTFWKQAITTFQVDVKQAELAVRSLKKRVYFCDGLPFLLSKEDEDVRLPRCWVAQSGLPEAELLAWIHCHWQAALG